MLSPPPRRYAVHTVCSKSVLLSLALACGACSGIGSQSAGPSPNDPAALTPTADAAVRSTPVVPGRRARVFVFAGLGDKCETLPAPQVTVTHAPAKGDISFVPGQETTIAASAQGTCTGKQATGTGVYYTARAGQQGTDRFSVTARLATGETATRNFEVHIAE